MLRKLYLFAVAVSVNSILFSCNQNKDTVVIDESLLTPGSAQQSQNTLRKDSLLPPAAAVQPGNQLLPQPSNQNTVSATPVVQPTVTQSAAAGQQLNPAHGQPGHRCDIQVGAPLNSKPAQTTQTQTTQAQAPTVTTTTPPTVVNSTPSQKALPGMNPQHGQPGHRCDIAVGAPLNSKPVTTATPEVTPAVQPAPSDTSKNN